MVRHRNRRKRSTTGRRQIRGTVSETIITQVKSGINTVQASHLTNTPHNSSWRIVSARVQLTFAVGTANPYAIQTLLYNPTGQAVAASGVRLLGNQPRTISLRYPANAEWFSPLSIAMPTTPVFQIDVICTGSVSSIRLDDQYVGCVISLRVATKQEVVQTTCPPKTLHHREHDEGIASSFASLEITSHQEEN